jgi:hypothetical protein
MQTRPVAAVTSVQTMASCPAGERGSSDLPREPPPAPMLMMLLTRLSYYTGVALQVRADVDFWAR